MRRQGGEVFRRAGRAWSFRYYDAHGVRRMKGGYATKGEARAALDEVLRQVRLGPLYRPNLTLSDLVARFLEQYEAAPSTVAWVEYHLGRATAAFGDVPIGQLDPAALSAWRRKLPEGSRHQTIKVLRQVLGAAVRWGWCERNAAQLVANPKAKRGEIHPFESWQEVVDVAAELGASARSRSSVPAPAFVPRSSSGSSGATSTSTSGRSPSAAPSARVA